MAQIKFYKLTALPSSPEPNSVYFIQDGSTFDLYVTDLSGVAVPLDVGSGGSGITQVADDPSPSLGGDLELGAFNIIGQLENIDFILDGGLL